MLSGGGATAVATVAMAMAIALLAMLLPVVAWPIAVFALSRPKHYWQMFVAKGPCLICVF